jgi:hypothetical protein
MWKRKGRSERKQGLVYVISPAKRKHQGEPFKAKKNFQFPPKAKSSKSKGPKLQWEILCLFCNKGGHMYYVGFKKWLAKK